MKLRRFSLGRLNGGGSAKADSIKVRYDYKERLVVQAVNDKQCFHNHMTYTCLLRTTLIYMR